MQEVEMMLRRYLLFLLTVLPILLIVLPAGIVLYFSPNASVAVPAQSEQGKTASTAPQPEVKVYRSEKQKTETIPLERYIEGVVAAEMPAEFELEALKAQALAARTYIVRRLAEGKFEDVPQGAEVLDTVQHQKYLDDEELKAIWKENYDVKRERIRQAVKGTAGMIVTFEGKPIDATFFSTSNGFTENANEYWNQSIPYLRSVASPWDRESPKYQAVTEMSLADFEQKLGVSLDAQAISTGTFYSVIERTTGNRVGRVQIGNKVFTGKEVREKLGLNSTAFAMTLKNNSLQITTQGYGHGVGMSQWGANGMAKEGKRAEQIIKYFYQGVSLEDYHKILPS
jgi:stage II sporulation protein D